MTGVKFVTNHGRYFFLSNRPQMINRPNLITSFFKSQFFQTSKQSSIKNFKSSSPIINLTRNFHNTSASKFRINNYNYTNTQQFFNLKKALIFSGIFVTATTLLTPILYKLPPLNHFKRNPSHLVYGIIGINVGVFFAWRIPKFWRVLHRFALLQKDRQYNSFQIIGSAFSQQEVWHLAMNMLALYSFGTSLAQVIGIENFTMLYLNGAVLSSLGSLAFPILMKIPLAGPSLGASGALFAVFGCFANLFPAAKIMLFIFPIPGGAQVAFLGAMIWNVAGCVMRWGSFDYAAHFVGGVFGGLYGWYLKDKADKERQRRLGASGLGRFW